MIWRRDSDFLWLEKALSILFWVILAKHIIGDLDEINKMSKMADLSVSILLHITGSESF